MDKECELVVPVVFNFFNRIDTALSVFESIRKAKPQKLYLVSDGPRRNREGEQNKVEQIRSEIESRIDWPCQVRKNYAQENMGCGQRIVSGYNWVFEQEEMAILLEDDTLPLQSFYPYAQELLQRYKDDERIMLIAGNNLYQDYEIKESYAFSRFPSTWGWATWARAWKCYDGTMVTWEKIKNRQAVEQYYGSKLGKLYKEVIEWGYTGKIDTWDWQWEASRLWNYGIGIAPKCNMISNIGFEAEEATHTAGKCIYNFQTEEMLFPLIHPETVLPDVELDKGYLNNIVEKELEGRTILGKIKRRLRRMVQAG